MQFEIPLVSPRLAALVALHGLLDFAHPFSLVAYAPMLPSAPAGSAVDTVAFALASIVHFSEDVNFLESALLHAAIVASYLLDSAEGAVVILLAHFSIVHLPRLWIQAFEEPRPFEALLLVASFVLAAVAPRRVCSALLGVKDDRFVLTYKLQRLVTCHVLSGLLR